MCEECFEELKERSNLECPFCRKRFHVQVRRRQVVVDGEFWALIQRDRPDLVRNKLDGTDDVDTADAAAAGPAIAHQIARQGELLREFEVRPLARASPRPSGSRRHLRYPRCRWDLCPARH